MECGGFNSVHADNCSQSIYKPRNTDSTLVATIRDLEQRYNDMSALAGGVLATLKANMGKGHQIDDISEWVDSWWRQYQEIGEAAGE